LLREPVRSLRRAGLVVLSRADLIDKTERQAIRERAEASAGRPIRWLEARHAPLDVLDADGRSYPLASTLGVPVAAFCGIGNPEGFRKTLEQIGTPLVGFQEFADHHPYHARDLSDLAAWATGLRAELVLTTQKDLVKLRTQALGSLPLRALRIGLDLIDGPSMLDEALTPLLPRSSPIARV
ncbi:MAG: tetraacyldisaccharide 4'-kinase, partial [Isosphaeraceae bacterium]